MQLLFILIMHYCLRYWRYWCLSAAPTGCYGVFWCPSCFYVSMGPCLIDVALGLENITVERLQLAT